MERRPFRCWLGHRWAVNYLSQWVCMRCDAGYPRCDNCGSQHDPYAFITICSVTRRLRGDSEQ